MGRRRLLTILIICMLIMGQVNLRATNADELDKRMPISSKGMRMKQIIESVNEQMRKDTIAIVKGGRVIPNRELERLSQRLGIDIRDEKHLELYREVEDWLGVAYRYGGMSRRAVDCSGFTNLIYRAVYDKDLPRSSRDMANAYKHTVSKGNLEPGDLVFFSTGRRSNRISHVGVYLGEGKFIHASTSRGVIVSSLDEKYYVHRWRKAVKVN